MDRLRKIHGINVDNVDKKVDNYYGKPVECRKHQYFSVLLMKMLSDYVNSLIHKKIYTSPAPIVINTSPWIQFFNKNSSISSKVEK